MSRLAKALRSLTDRSLLGDWIETRTLRKFPRYRETTAKIMGKTVVLPDSASYLFMKGEIFRAGIYKFRSVGQSPFIIDGGANIGLATIYFKTQYPSARVIAFEADPYIAGFFRKNVFESFGLNQVELVERALWSETTSLQFSPDRADAGRVGSSVESLMIQTDVLSRHLKTDVDLLKLDIEGAEWEVLQECSASLSLVRNIFVEYHSFVGRKQELSGILEILGNAGFRVYVTVPGFHNVRPLWERRTYEGMDLQLNIFGCRE
jgi:FkbM family methyltransferase